MRKTNDHLVNKPYRAYDIALERVCIDFPDMTKKEIEVLVDCQYRALRDYVVNEHDGVFNIVSLGKFYYVRNKGRGKDGKYRSNRNIQFKKIPLKTKQID